MIILILNNLTLMILLKRSPKGILILYKGAIIKGKYSGKRRLLRGLLLSLKGHNSGNSKWVDLAINCNGSELEQGQ